MLCLAFTKGSKQKGMVSNLELGSQKDARSLIYLESCKSQTFTHNTDIKCVHHYIHMQFETFPLLIMADKKKILFWTNLT